MKVGVAGVGVVGGALTKYLESVGHEVVKYDPPLGLNGDLSLTDVVFICVPAPTLEDRSLDLSIVRLVLIELLKKDYQGAVCLKSSLLPGTTNRFKFEHPQLNFYYTPEFLVARQAYEDIQKQPIVIGIIDDEFEEFQNNFTNDVSKLFSALFIHQDLIFCTTIEAEMIKYAHNCFGAIQVNYFNIIYEACKRSKCDYDRVINGISPFPAMQDRLIKVPGPDGLRGYGGACFPKDTKAFIGFLEKMNIDHLSISGAELDNEMYRNNI